jgi:hypothetical protein
VQKFRANTCVAAIFASEKIYFSKKKKFFDSHVSCTLYFNEKKSFQKNVKCIFLRPSFDPLRASLKIKSFIKSKVLCEERIVDIINGRAVK